MKILDVPQSGKRGITVSQGGRYGQFSRALAIPVNPKSTAQRTIRNFVSQVSKRWRTLTESERSQWRAAAVDVMSKSRLGQYGSLTGIQLFSKINVALATYGQDQVDTPPAFPDFPDLAPQNLFITNAVGVITLKLTCPTDPGQITIVRASRPISAGVNRVPDVVNIGMCPTPSSGAADITSLYTARYGSPAVGTKVFVTCNIIVDGWESDPVAYSAIVPQA